MLFRSALLASAFATKVWHLLLTQGILYGIGASLVNTVSIQYLNEWFIERKGLAFGIQESGAGMGGIIIPYVSSGIYSLSFMANDTTITDF